MQRPFRSAVLAAALIGIALVSSPARAQRSEVQVADLSALGADVRIVIMPSQQGSDTLYRRARDAMDRGEFRRAAEMFAEVRDRNPRAGIAADALYWQAYSLYRLGNRADLRSALASLQTLNRQYAQASVAGDGRQLRVRVCGELAQLGDERCASELSDVASGSSSGSGSGSGSGTSNSPSTARSGQEQSCASEDDDERVAALNALLQMNSDQALPILERVLARRERCSVTLRRKAIFLVSQKRSDRAIDMLLSAARTDPDREVREQAIFWIGQTGGERAVDLLEGIITRERDPELLKKAVFSLSQNRSARAATILRDLAQSDNTPTEVRADAIFWIGQGRGARENLSLLTSLYPRVSEKELKDKIIFSVSQINTPEAGKWMLDLALNEREGTETRKQALFWAGQSRRTSVDDLIGLYSRVRDREMKEQMIFVFSQRRDAAVVDKLMDIAKNDPDRELRGKALFWLGQSKDPRVLRFLEEVINR